MKKVLSLLLPLAPFTLVFGQSPIDQPPNGGAPLEQAQVSQIASPGSADPGEATGTVPVRQVVVSSSGVFALDRSPTTIEIERVHVDVELEEASQRQFWTIELRNRANRPDWANLLLPIPTGFEFESATAEPDSLETLEPLDTEATFGLLRRTAQESGVRAAMEWSGHRSVYLPQLAFGASELRTVHVVLAASLNTEGDLRIEVPRSELPGRTPIELSVEVRGSTAQIYDFHSPSHALRVAVEEGQRIARWNSQVDAQPGPLVVVGGRPQSEEAQGMNLATTLEQDGEGGLLFAIWARPDEELEAQAPQPSREMTLVVDVSGSMSGTKIRQARDAGLQFLGSLNEGDRFQVLTYAKEVNALFSEPRLATDQNLIAGERFVEDIEAGGNTNLSGALELALTTPTEGDLLPYVLVLSDGKPTAGLTDEAQLVRATASTNPHDRRLYTFGIGHDVNAPLLDGLARASRGASAYVEPDADVEDAVVRCLRGLTLPLWTTLELLESESDSEADQSLALVPNTPLRDVFAGETLFAFGRIPSAQPTQIKFVAHTSEGPRETLLQLDPALAAPAGGPLGALFATRRSAELLERIRATGAEAGDKGALRRVESEMVELLQLALRSGILSSHTMFLSLPDTELLGYDQLLQRLGSMLTERVMRARVGRAVFQDAVSLGRDRDAKTAERVRRALSAGDAQLTISGVAHLGGHGYFQRGPMWIDGALIGPDSTAKVDVQLSLADPKTALLAEELAECGRSALLALPGGVVFELDGQVIAISPQ